MTAWKQSSSDQTTRWISRDFAELLDTLRKKNKSRKPTSAATPAFDVLIVGSGYGGAIAASELAGCLDESGRPITVCILERGREYLPGAFPSRVADLPTQVRGAFGAKTRGGEGLFDLRAGGDVSVVLANGLGGGSLINAGVMEIPKAEVFDARWPEDLRGDKRQDPYYLRAKRMLGATAGKRNNDISLHPQLHNRRLDKNKVLKSLAEAVSPRYPGRAFRDAAITIAMQEKTTSGGVRLKACQLCGDCATGCNYGAKESLDTNLLVQAFRRGAQIYCGATVLKLEKPDAASAFWRVLVTHTDEQLRQREGRPSWITARKIILAAGALGSTEILLRTRQAADVPLFSGALGQRFSTNGDMIGFGYDYRVPANAIADEDQVPDQRRVGPTITGVIDATVQVGGQGQQRIVIEELAIPGALRRVAEEVVTTSNTLHSLAEFDLGRHKDGHPENDPFAVNPDKIRRTSVFAAMGDDGAGGTLRLSGGDVLEDDGRIAVVWPGVNKLPIFDAQTRIIQDLARSAGFGGRTIANPLWRLLPESMAPLIHNRRGPLVTVHPLGGCPMGNSAADGVVNQFGQVFDAGGAAGAVHDGLIVLDGAIVPSALSTNPALTIAALALRAVEHLRDVWKWTRPGIMAGAARTSAARPQLADIRKQILKGGRAAPQATVAEFTERLSGPLWLREKSGAVRRFRAEITLTYDRLALNGLTRPDAKGRLDGARLSISADDATPKGLLRIYLEKDFEQFGRTGLKPEQIRRLQARARTYALSGSLILLRREASGPLQRTARSLGAWALNRGLRDIYQEIFKQDSKSGTGSDLLEQSPMQKALSVLQLASRAGEVRLFEYELVIGAELHSPYTGARFEPAQLLAGAEVLGHKRITYARLSNPWAQLQEMTVTRFPGMVGGKEPRVLSLDLPFLAARAAPLFRLTAQRDHLEALVDTASLAAYFLRMLLSIHIWSARKPELPRQRKINRLPDTLPGLPPPDIHCIEVDRLDGKPVEARLTRYCPARAGTVTATAPVVMIHGYSASGTTFAHEALRPSLAQYLVQAGRDVWVLDLRSSCGMPTATHPWTFEDMALADIPAAIDYVCRQVGQGQVDVVAHCMGAAMLSMAVLSANKPVDEICSQRERRVRDQFQAERRALPGRLRKVVLSQIGPVMVLSQENVFRAYVLSFMEQVIGPLSYRFRPRNDEGLVAELLDRLLATHQYPVRERALESPWLPWRRTAFVGSRHRMDALFGRTFKLGKIGRETLDRIDDFFGPISLDTVAQVIHFAQYQTITNRDGRNRFVTPEALRDLWTFPTLSIHGEENGLADVATADRVHEALTAAGCRHEVIKFPGRGHQDCLIGKDATEVFGRIRSFLDAGPAIARPEKPAAPIYAFTAETPWMGPMQVVGPRGKLSWSMGASPLLAAPLALCMLPLQRHAGKWIVADGLVGRSRRGTLPVELRPQTFRAFAETDDTDWFTQSMPAWARRPQVEYVALLLIYPQAVCRDLPTSCFGVRPGPAAKGVKSAYDPAVYAALKQAIASALEQFTDAQLPGSLIMSRKTVGPADSLCLALGSCQYPPGMLDQVPAYRSWDRLNQHLRQRDKPFPQLMILAGDQVYTDATAGLFDPSQLDDRFRKPYEAWLSNPRVQDVLRRIPLATMIDDHEITNNWEPVAAASEAAYRENQELLKDGTADFRRFQRTNPHGKGTKAAAAPLWFAFESGGVPIFMLNSRTERSRRAVSATQPEKMFGDRQFTALKNWLTHSEHRGKPKLIVAPSLILPRHRWAVPARLACGQSDASGRAALRSDSWDGYVDTCYELLGFIAKHKIDGVVFLSGDEHLGLFTRMQIDAAGARGAGKTMVYSVHSPGLYTPYRFANARPSDFILDETFEFASTRRPGTGARYRCTVKTEVLEGAGFVLVSLQPSPTGAGWTMRCEFKGGPAFSIPLKFRRILRP